MQNCVFINYKGEVMEVVCTKCKEIRRINRVERAICEKCQKIMSPYEKDVLAAVAANNGQKNMPNKGSIGL